MIEKKSESIQNRFTAYLLVAIKNKKAEYWTKKNKTKGVEIVIEDLDNNYHTDFNHEFSSYMNEKLTSIKKQEDILNILRVLEGERIAREIHRLKENEIILLFGRIFEELSFEELAQKLDLTPKQAEMAFYYVVRKIRKKMEGYLYEF